MAHPAWFIPAPDNAIAQRVTLTLGMAAAQRYFRQVAVPGIGGALFVRHCSWAVAAIALQASIPRLTAARIANGIEAIACKLAAKEVEEDERGGRIRGIRAFARDPDLTSFSALSQPRNYVHITFRQSVVTALTTEAGLGFTEGGRRFNAMVLTAHGLALAEAFLEQQVGKGGGALRRTLLSWLTAEQDVTTDSVRKALSPWAPRGEEAILFLARLRADHAPVPSIGPRARARLMEEFDRHGAVGEPDLATILHSLRSRGEESHARALEAAVAFEDLFSCAQKVVHAAAACLEDLGDSAVTLNVAASEKVGPYLRRLQESANAYQQKSLAAEIDHLEAGTFMRKVLALKSPSELLGMVIARDGQVLAPEDGARVKRGILFASWRPITEAAELDASDAGLRSPRLRQAFRLWQDCHGS